MQVGRQARVRAGSGGTGANAGLFAGTLAQNAGLNVRVTLPEAIAAGRTAQALLQGIAITSFDNNSWDLWLWANKNFQVPGQDATAEDFRGFWSFVAADAKRIGATGLYYYYIGLDPGVFYEDTDAGATANVNAGIGAFLNVTLVNRSAGAKTAGQWFDVAFLFEPTLGW